MQNNTTLDSREEIAKIDKSNLLGSVEALADQVQHAWKEIQKLDFTLQRPVKNVVVVGMGGSALGPDNFKHLFKDQLQIPFEIYNSYSLPAYVDENSLVILSSYSGNTEEVIGAAEQAQKTGAQIFTITAGGKLKEIAEKNNYPTYLIDPVHNPSNQPRMAIGYAIFGLIGMMAKAGLIEITQNEIDEVVTSIIRTSEGLSVETSQDSNRAKILAFTIIEQRPVMVGSEFLVGAMHTAANQFNENTKMYADYKIVPEINHHLMEGLKFPKSNALSHIFLFFQSDLYNKRNQKRIKLTQEVVEQNKIETIQIQLESETKLAQALELITLMAYTNFYISVLEGLDAAAIPFVDWFKKEMG